MLTPFFSAVVAASQAEEKAPTIAPPFVIGGTIFVVLLVLMFVTVSYTNLGNRHEPVEEHADPHRAHPNKHDRGQAQAHS
ncbi:hypothetical protein KIH31_14680 [Paenarthrobacter sp. DKR-5]|uniref:hypothetical protein n=1 Tax=Paenarthrobacter sp. DKR-5 TaxID=2835535 RepID=UPI001BDC3593|nr:hypothetical protein [Paenarthrobacter sp. DKR-5]MBT1003845.1 hypothetical protein [Paenarthrobacter sp. DKR-5]